MKGLVNPAAMARMSLGESLTNLVFANTTGLEDVKYSGNWMYAAKLPGRGAIDEHSINVRSHPPSPRVCMKGSLRTSTRPTLDFLLLLRASCVIVHPAGKSCSDRGSNARSQLVLDLVDPCNRRRRAHVRCVHGAVRGHGGAPCGGGPQKMLQNVRQHICQPSMIDLNAARLML
jgi:hypothetical protein